MPRLVVLTGPIAAGKNTVADELARRLTGRGKTVVVVVGPIYAAEEQAALTAPLPDGAAVLWIVIDAPVSVTFPRAQSDPGRGLSRDPEFHHAAHRRFRTLLPAIPADRVFDSEKLEAERIASEIAGMLTVR